MDRSIAISYDLYIGGKLIDFHRKSLIQNIELEENSSGSDILTISIADPDFVFIEDNIFVEETHVMFVGGLTGQVPVKFSGFISVIDVDFPEDGFPTLTIHCMDETHLMNRKKKKRSWKNARKSDVAAKIYKEYGFKTVIDPTPKIEKTISQSNQTDIEFIVGLAGNQNDDQFITYVTNGTAYFVKKPLIQKSEVEIGYRTGNGYLMSFSPRINKETKMEEIEDSDVNLADASVVTEKATDSTTRQLQGESVKTSSSYKYVGNQSWVKQESKK